MTARTWAQESKPDRAAQASDTKPEAIDFNKARQLLQKQRAGEKLTADEAAYLRRAQEARRNGQNPPGQPGRPMALQPRETTGLKPLSEMQADDKYQGEDGGLYGAGRNTPPAEHQRAAEIELSRIQPLNAAGKPDANGKIVFISISMSNATQEFSLFKRIADADPAKSRQLTIVDCAQGGQAMAEWVSPTARPWQVANERLANSGVSPAQVQVAWVKLANKGPTGDLAAHGRKLQRDTEAVLRNAKAKFPNLRIAYLSSRIYGGYAAGNLNPEPYAYESAFAVRWLIQEQIKGTASYNWDAEHGSVQMPLLLWGPYLWADGVTPRASDKLVYTRSDLGGDGTHPSDSGREKVARQLLNFVKTDPLAKSWFTGATR
ncbi:MAG: hypothetical protein B7Z55_10090 [Planctomycetales bacterium 12-60-4]|nr:MAG: hypothetical protein B7Z55_10090 [Planctomycetales bacterium 12-60-4]